MLTVELPEATIAQLQDFVRRARLLWADCDHALAQHSSYARSIGAHYARQLAKYLAEVAELVDDDAQSDSDQAAANIIADEITPALLLLVETAEDYWITAQCNLYADSPDAAFARVQQVVIDSGLLDRLQNAWGRVATLTRPEPPQVEGVVG